MIIYLVTVLLLIQSLNDVGHVALMVKELQGQRC